MNPINTDLSQVLSPKYTNKWVALNSAQTKVVASGKSPKEVLELARKKDFKKPVVTFVVDDYGFLVP